MDGLSIHYNINLYMTKVYIKPSEKLNKYTIYLFRYNIYLLFNLGHYIYL